MQGSKPEWGSFTNENYYKKFPMESKMQNIDIHPLAQEIGALIEQGRIAAGRAGYIT